MNVGENAETDYKHAGGGRREEEEGEKIIFKLITNWNGVS